MFALTFASSTIKGLQKINDYQSTSSDASKVVLEADALAPPSSNKLCIMSPKEIKRLCIKVVFKSLWLLLFLIAQANFSANEKQTQERSNLVKSAITVLGIMIGSLHCTPVNVRV